MVRRCMLHISTILWYITVLYLQSLLGPACVWHTSRVESCATVLSPRNAEFFCMGVYLLYVAKHGMSTLYNMVLFCCCRLSKELGLPADILSKGRRKRVMYLPTAGDVGTTFTPRTNRSQSTPGCSSSSSSSTLPRANGGLSTGGACMTRPVSAPDLVSRNRDYIAPSKSMALSDDIAPARGSPRVIGSVDDMSALLTAAESSTNGATAISQLSRCMQTQRGAQQDSSAHTCSGSNVHIGSSSHGMHSSLHPEQQQQISQLFSQTSDGVSQRSLSGGSSCTTDSHMLDATAADAVSSSQEPVTGGDTISEPVRVGCDADADVSFPEGSGYQHLHWSRRQTTPHALPAQLYDSQQHYQQQQLQLLHQQQERPHIAQSEPQQAGVLPSTSCSLLSPITCSSVDALTAHTCMLQCSNVAEHHLRMVGKQPPVLVVMDGSDCSTSWTPTS